MTCAAGVRWERVALTPGKHSAGRGGERRGRKTDTREGVRRVRRAKKAWAKREKDGWRTAKEA